MIETRLFIPTVGRGSRVNQYTEYTNKCLVPYEGRPAIHKIIKSVPTDMEIIVAIGYKGNYVREFCEIAFPNRNIKFVDLGETEYLKAFSGPATTLLKCKEHLEDRPFIFWACDTIVSFNRSLINDRSWGGISTHHNNIGKYRKVSGNDFIGIGKVDNSKNFFDNLQKETSESLEFGFEFIGYEFEDLVDFGDSWVDLGNYTNIDTDNPWEKYHEQTWIVNDKVIKLFDSEERKLNFIKSAKYIPNSPKILTDNEHFICYYMERGKVLSSYIDIIKFRKLLEFLVTELWSITPERLAIDSKEFYIGKTFSRAQSYIEKNKDYCKINGQNYHNIEHYLSKIPSSVWETDPVNIHGDLHFDNIICKKNGEFSLIDWRPTTNCDIYYDLAKLLHGLYLSHKTEFYFEVEGDNIKFDIMTPYCYQKCKEELFKFLELLNFSKEKTEIINALIFINMSPLHKEPLSTVCYCLGKELLHECLIH